MTNPHGNFIWYELLTPDPDAAKRFYDAVVGWDIEPAPSGEMDYRMITIPKGGNVGGVMRLSPEMAELGARPIWLGYLGVNDVDAMVASVEYVGGKTLMPAHDLPGVGRFAMIVDPQGAPLYIMAPTPPPGQEDAASNAFSVDQPMHIRWNELATSDPDASIHFYKQHFGWHQQGDMDMGPMGKYRFLQHGGVGIGAVMAKPPQMPASMWSYYIGVDDIDRAAKAVTDGGGTIVHGPVEIPGGEYSLNAIDPQQAVFGLVGPRRA
jgi:predicted enzyme related to lactoylglutathione lyase